MMRLPPAPTTIGRWESFSTTMVARKVVIVADSSKVGKRAFARICSPAEIDVLVTDTGIAAEDAVLLEDAGVEVVTA